MKMPKILTKKLILLITFLCFLLPCQTFARSFVSDWYIRDFESEIIVNKDSSLLITEKIIADCDNLPDKHGIFRILPSQIKTTDEEIIKTPIQLISITDFYDRPLKYSAIKNNFNKTITWKIGDPKITVTGENYYKIVYKVKNTIRFGNLEFDELYWNLLGTFWDLEIDNFTAKIILPEEVTKENAKIEYYTGFSGQKDKNLATYQWINNNTLEFRSTRTLLERQGITASITFPKNIFTPSKLSLIEKYDNSLWFLVPIFVLLACFFLWLKYGKDPKIDKTVIPEFEIPENISPMGMGLLLSNGSLKNNYLTASILNLAVKGLISIEETKIGFLHRRDFILKDLSQENQIKDLDPIELLILQGIFWEGKKEVLLSSLRSKFYKNIPEIKKRAMTIIFEKDLMVKKSLTFQVGLYVVASLLFLLFIFVFRSTESFISAFVSATIIFVFSFAMPKRTEKGAELVWRLQGFKLYMETAEKYRQQFYEKENIFEKLLPYAMVFGMTKLWIKKMREIYGEQYFATYHPAWYIGSNVSAFDVDSFNSTMNNLSSSIGSNVGGPSGAGGAGGAGGGGGGGGGGGW